MDNNDFRMSCSQCYEIQLSRSDLRYDDKGNPLCIPCYDELHSEHSETPEVRPETPKPYPLPVRKN